jgi:hypothetical protein
MLLRCGECETLRDVVAADDVARALERDLRRGMATIRAALERMDRERMIEQTAAFVVALHRDLIDAEDFAITRVE